MHVPITLAALTCLTAVLLLLRNAWPRLRPTLRYLLVGLSVLFILVSAQTFVLGWNTRSFLINSCVRWLAVAGYEFLLLLFTRLRPRWLTTGIAVILLLPVLGASIILPLTYLFDRDPVQIVHLSPELLITETPWNAAGLGNSGTDVGVYRIPPHLPFVRDLITNTRLYESQCDTAAVTATFDPAAHTVVVRCPPSAAHAGDPPHQVVVHVPRNIPPPPR